MPARAPFFKHAFLYAILLASAFCSGCASTPPLRYIGVPLVDLRAKPYSAPRPGIQDPLQETQLLYGEAVQVLRAEGPWAYVEAPEQPEFTHAQRWQGYPGWIPRAALIDASRMRAPTVVVTAPWTTLKPVDVNGGPPVTVAMGTRLPARYLKDAGKWEVPFGDATYRFPGQDAAPLESLNALPDGVRRQRIVRLAESLIGSDYFWGGRSATSREVRGVTGVDCSGLVNLAYRAAGLDIPRDAHEQYLRARPVPRPLPGDLIFLSSDEDPQKIVHVMLYAGGETIIEGPGTGMQVHRIETLERLGGLVAGTPAGSRYKEQTIYYGTYFNEP